MFGLPPFLLFLVLSFPFLLLVSDDVDDDDNDDGGGGGGDGGGDGGADWHHFIFISSPCSSLPLPSPLDLYEEGQWTATSPFVYMSVMKTVSTMLAMFHLVQFYRVFCLFF